MGLFNIEVEDLKRPDMITYIHFHPIVSQFKHNFTNKYIINNIIINQLIDFVLN